MIALPRHQNPSPARRACAPYTFIPLPDTVVLAVDDPWKLPRHDSFHNPGYPHSGYFDVALTTLTPTYVRCGLTRDQFDRQEKGEDETDLTRIRNQVNTGARQLTPGEQPFRDLVRHTPDFFYTNRAGDPEIPGSSLRGMLRAMVAIISYGKVHPVTDASIPRLHAAGNYTHTPRGLEPEDLRRSRDIDFAEALFGYSKDEDSGYPQGTPGRSYAGRVRVTAGRWDGKAPSDGLWLENRPIVPAVLSTPRPSAFSRYLVQQDESKLADYDRPFPQTTIRGSKRYWRKGPRTADDIRPNVAYRNAGVQPFSTQHTQFKPVNPGVTFVSRVYFDNLSDAELGALCWALQPLGEAGKAYTHSVGMGKPLGMGVIRLWVQLTLIDRETRYSSLFDSDKRWTTGIQAPEKLADRTNLERRTQKFEEIVLKHLPFAGSCSHLFELERIGMLLKSMEWEGYPPSPPDHPITPGNRYRNTRYMVAGEPISLVLPDARDFGPLSGYVSAGGDVLIPAQEPFPAQLVPPTKAQTPRVPGTITEAGQDMQTEIRVRPPREPAPQPPIPASVQQTPANIPQIRSVVNVITDGYQGAQANHVWVRLSGTEHIERLQMYVAKEYAGQFVGKGAEVQAEITNVNSKTGKITGVRYRP